MILTSAQLAAIKADIANNSDLNVFPNNSDGNTAIAAIYNILASPDFWVWRTKVMKNEFVTAISPDGTTFIWGGAQAGNYIDRSVAEKTAWSEMFDSGSSVNPSLANVRAAWLDIFSGAGAGAVNNRAHLLAVSRRKSSRIEKLLAVGTGSTALPATMGSEGPITYLNIESARNS